MLGRMIVVLGPGEVARRCDLLDALGQRQLNTALASGVLVQPWRGVVIRSADALDLHTRAAAAVLAVGERAVVSGPTAVALHGHDAAEAGPIHLTVPYDRGPRSRTGLIVHQNRFTFADVVPVGDLPVFARDLALADYLCDGDKRAAFASLDQALGSVEDGEVLRAAVRARLAERDDRRGVARAEMLTELATGKAESPPESIFRLIVVEAGLPIPEPQYEVRLIDGRPLYVLDMAWKELRVALEYDGYAAHEERADYDADRDARLTRRGWIVVRATAADLKDPSRVLAELRTALHQRQALARRPWKPFLAA